MKIPHSKNRTSRLGVKICAGLMAVFALAGPSAATESADIPAKGGYAFIQQVEPGGLDLTEAISLAMSNNLRVLSSREERAKAAGNMAYYRSAMYPAINLTGSGTTRDDNSLKPRREAQADVGLTQYLYAGGAVRAGINMADYVVSKAEEDVRNTEESVAYNTYVLFHEVLFRQSVYRTTLDAVRYYENAAKELRKRMELGLATKLDVIRMEQQRENAVADSISAANDITSARILLYTELRVPPETSMDVTGVLDSKGTYVSKDEAMTRAMSHRADLKSLVLARDIQKQNIEITKAGMRPIVTLGATYQLGYTATDGYNNNNDDWNAKINLTVPLFDGGKTKGQVMKQEGIYRQVVNDVTSKEDVIKSEVVNAYLNLNSVLEGVAAAKKNLEMARESLRLSEVGYKEGVNTQIDVLQTRTTLTEAEQKLASYMLGYCNALARIWDAQGVLVENTVGRDSTAVSIDKAVKNDVPADAGAKGE